MQEYEIKIKLASEGTVVVRANDEYEAENIAKKNIKGRVSEINNSGDDRIIDWQFDMFCNADD